MYFDTSSPVLENLLIISNRIGMLIDYCNLIHIKNAVIRNNREGGVMTYISTTRIANSLIENNGSYGFCAYSGAPILTNVTIANNTRDGLVSAFSDTNVLLGNCIVWGNSRYGFFSDYSGNFTVENSIVQGGYPGTGNKNENPQFVDAANGNFNLKRTSPAINMGNNDNYANAATSTDLLGKSRLSLLNIDGTIWP